MWQSGLILLALGVAVAYDADLLKERLTQFRIRSQNLHVDDLEREVEELEHEFDQLSAPIRQTDVSKVKGRLENLEGSSSCAETDVSCGGQIPECVNHLLFCDGYKDCKNGHDEDEEVCSLDIIRPGSTFKGVMRYRGEDHVSVVTIVQSRRDELGPLAWVRFIVNTRAPEDEYKMLNYDNSGYYLFGFRKLMGHPMMAKFDHLTHTCDFYLGDNDHLVCTGYFFYGAAASRHKLVRV